MGESDLRFAWRLYRAAWQTYTYCVLTLFASWVLLEVAVVAVSRLGIWPWLVLHAGFLVLFSGLWAGLHRISIAAAEGRSVQFRTMGAHLDQGPTLLAVFVAYLFVVAAGLALLIVPGVFLAARLVLVGQVASLQPQLPWTALARTAAITRGHFWGALRTLLTIVLLNLAGAALLGIGLLVTVPLSVLVATHFYETCKATNPPRT